jgi:uncharacterized protein (UPF0276 family)
MNHDLRGLVGIGLRAALAEELRQRDTTPARFVEVAPENYLGVGGKRGRLLAMAKERWPVVSHGLCGDFAGSGDVDDDLLAHVRGFLRQMGARWYSDHLCLTRVDGAETHDLLPLPFTDEAVERSARRLETLQDRLGLPVAVENVSAYFRHAEDTMDEPTFVRRVVEESGCSLLLDVNNVYVNAVNFGFDPRAYVEALPLERVVQMHMAGHHVEAADDAGRPVLVVDTHGAAIIDPVSDLFAYVIAAFKQRGLVPAPVLLERDHHIPPLGELEAELARLQSIVDGGAA